MVAMVKIAPSILSADLSCLREVLKLCELGGADIIHVDVMDGHFVPNITMGPVVVKWMRKCTDLPLEAHLMIEEPVRYVRMFIEAGIDMATLHAESKNIEEAAKILRSEGVRVGIALNPDTPVEILKNYDFYEYILVMTVYPGFAGQKFIEWASDKIPLIRRFYDGDIMVDGGINFETAKIVVRKGANVLAAATAIFNGNVIENIKRLREEAESLL